MGLDRTAAGGLPLPAGTVQLAVLVLETIVPPCAPPTLRAEFMDWIVCLMVESGMMRAHMGAAIRFEGRLDEQRLARALRLLLDAEPVLGCRFVAEHDLPHWERPDDLDGLVTVPVRVSDDAAADAASFVAAGLDIHGGPQVFAEVFRSPGGDTLAVKVNHASVDGGAMKQTLYHLAQIYRQLASDPGYVPECDADAPRTLAAIARTATPGERLKALRLRRHFPRTDWSVRGLGGEGEPAYIDDVVEPLAFRRLIEFGKMRGATVHDVLLAGYYRALYAVLKPAEGSHTPVNMSADLRAWLPSGIRMAPANLPTTWAVDVPFQGTESFEATLARVVEQTRDFKDADVGRVRAFEAMLGDRLVRLVGMRTMRRYWARITRAFEGTGYPSLTNLGVLDEEALGFGADAPVAGARLFGPVGHPGGFILTVSTFRHRFQLSAGIDAGAMDAELARRIVHTTAAELRSAAGVD